MDGELFFIAVREVAEFGEVALIEGIGGGHMELGLGRDKYGGFGKRYAVADHEAVGIADVGGGMAGVGVDDNGVGGYAEAGHQEFLHFDGFAIGSAEGVAIAAADDDE